MLDGVPNKLRLTFAMPRALLPPCLLLRFPRSWPADVSPLPRLEVERSCRIQCGRWEEAVAVRCGVAIGSIVAPDMRIAAPSAPLAGTLRAATMSGIDSVVDGIVLVVMLYEVSLTTCDNPFCRRVAGLCHTRCCSLCTDSQGRDHTGSCNERQGFVYVSGGAEGVNEGQGPSRPDDHGPSTEDVAGTPWCAGHPAAPDAESPAPDHGRPGSSTDASLSQIGETFHGLSMGMGTHTIFIFDSDEEADIARAIAASLEGSTVDASMNDFSLEEMD